MFSPGKYHLQVPKDPAKNVEFRRRLLLAAAGDRRVQRGLLEMCRLDILFWINAFVWQYNPLKLGREYGPFITWGFQDEALCSRDPERPGLLWCMENGRSAVIEKSREMGGTYLCVLLEDWLCMFHENKNVLTVSRTEDAVYKNGDPNSIFWKIEEVHRFLPGWMTAGTESRKLFFGYGRTSSRNTGTASTGKAGTGGRVVMAFADEFSLIVEDTDLRRRLASTSNFRVFNGTHQGLHTEFNRLVNDPEYIKIVMHWTQHPDKVAGLYQFDPTRPGQPILLDPTYEYPADYNFVLDGTPTGGPRPGVRSPWYDKKCREIGDARAVAMELDINPTGAVSQVFNSVLIQSLVYRCARPAVWRGDLEFDDETCRPERLVARENGPIRMWVPPRGGGKAPPGKWAFGGDLSQGVGRTPSVFSGGDVTVGGKTFEYANPGIYPQNLARVMVAMCRHFEDAAGRPAFLGWEMQGPGVQFGIEVVKTGFRNFYHNIDQTKIRRKLSDKPGWYPAPKAKVLLIRQYMAALESGAFENPSREALLETLKLMWSTSERIVHPEELADDDPSGAGANHADRVVADALLCMLMGPRGDRAARAKEEPVPYQSFLWRRLQRQREALAEAES